MAPALDYDIEAARPDAGEKRPSHSGKGDGFPEPSSTTRVVKVDHAPPHHGLVDPASRLPIEYRTLSIHVDTMDQLGYAGKKKAKGANVKDLTELDWHKVSVLEVLRRLSVSPETGLDSTQCSRRLASNGKNVISPPPSRLLQKILSWIFGGFGSLLLVCSIVCFIAWKPLGNPNPQASNLALAVLLLLVVLLQTVFNAWQDFSTSRVMASIQGLLPGSVSVIRDSIQKSVPAADLVVGDLVIISLGIKIPADLRIIENSGLRFDRAILTGESEPVSGTVDKTDDNMLETKNVALQGTHCVAGSGIGVVIQTGDNTVFGRIAKLSANASSTMTTLQRELLHFVVIIACLALAIAVVIVILWAGWLRRSHPDYINVPNLLIDIVSVMVTMVPEGLPVAVTLSLAKVASTLGSHKVICKSLSIVETLGAVNVLCSDKTGTLTKNQMHVEDCAIYDHTYTKSSFQTLINNTPPDHVRAENIAQMAAVGAICNGAEFSKEASEGSKNPIIGDATDSAILRFADSLVPVEESRRPWDEVYKINFSSKTKFMLKLSKLATSDLDGDRPAPLASWDYIEKDCYLLTSKGAPEILLPRCSYVLNPTGGAPIPLTHDVSSIIAKIQEDWASEGRRVLLLARRVLPSSLVPENFKGDEFAFEELVEEMHRELVVVGLVALIDPLKDDIVHTVRVCRGAGIRFLVVTGDHPATSVAIATQAGIISNPATIHHASDLNPKLDPEFVTEYDYPDKEGRALKSIVITGPELSSLNSTQMHQLIQYDEIVFARTTPEQKLTIVREFQKRLNVVAMTGDGVNDAPSLKAADIGIAMGSGSDVAREAADMVLLDSFESIVVALEYGRLVFDNLKKTILYLLPGGCFAELMPVLLNIIIGVPQVLSNLQMIIICIGTDMASALSLCLEKPEQGLLTRKPRNIRKDRLANLGLFLQAYCFMGVLQCLCAMSMSFWYLQRRGIPFSSLVFGYGNWPNLSQEDLDRAQSVYFFTIVITQWGNLMSTRCRRLSIFQHTPAKNWYLFPAMACGLCIAVFVSYAPFFQKILQTRGVAVEFYFIPMTFVIGIIFCDEMRKHVVRTYPNSFVAKLSW
ncbi:sodium-potassium ATPase [Sistotremastrum niveocremeum HHB9708]|uniref:Sodium-potassium ATPase n=1 Tax=Sistotremastrum niveocremeum HHB9708 TaxID=1314777 RepID=A0A164PWJ5_9AGAM|nr:sodium-potassium ATPase [Sistotremastrum niveocremeum HHB9708]